MELDGKVALVTGGGSGIGRAVALRCAAEAMRVCVVDRDADAAHAVAVEVGGIAVVADVGDAAQVDAAFAECADRLGGPDLAVCNAGIAIGVADLTLLDDAEYRRILGPNVDGVVFSARAAIRAMRARGGGVIVATASLAGLMGFAPDPVYALTKHAVVGLVRSIAPTLAADGIAAHAVCPGLTDTAILGPEIRGALDAAGFPLMDPAQIAEAVVTAARAPAEASGTCWVCQPGRAPTPFEFHRVPGPRTDAGRGQVPTLPGAPG
ncbi:MAG: SDR family oxidoreductase [Actinobacteria bacterium]|nr:SDR family oxidoreductase [Actinomycetota bacterium]